MKNFKLIDNYFRGELNENQMHEFELKLKKDPAFANEVNSYKASQNLIEAIIQVNLRKSLNYLDAAQSDSVTPRIASHHSDNTVQFETENNTQNAGGSMPANLAQSNTRSSEPLENYPSKTRSIFSGARLAAASIIIVLCIGGIWVSNLMKSDFSSITNDHMTFTEYIQVRSVDEYQVTIAQIAALEKAKNYKGANELIAEKMAANPEVYGNLQYFYGQNLFRMKNFDEAGVIFDQIIQSDDRRYTESAQLMNVFIEVERKQYDNALSTIASLEADPFFSMKIKLAQIKLAVQRQQ